MKSLRRQIGVVSQQPTLFAGSVRGADLILVMEAGEIIEFGTHEDLARMVLAEVDLESVPRSVQAGTDC